MRPRPSSIARQSVALRATVVLLLVIAALLGGAKPAHAATLGRVEGSGTANLTWASAVNIRNVQAGSTAKRTYTFSPTCTVGLCDTVLLQQRASGSIRLKLVPSTDRYIGDTTFLDTCLSSDGAVADAEGFEIAEHIELVPTVLDEDDYVTAYTATITSAGTRTASGTTAGCADHTSEDVRIVGSITPPPAPLNCAKHPEVDPVTCYAPEVRLDSLERNYPMGTSEFIAHSSLRWAHDRGCPDAEVVARGKVDESSLGLGKYSQRQAGRFCRATGREYTSDETTRPSQGGKARDLATNEGFFLDLDDAWRSGDVPSNDTVDAPITYAYSRGAYITYWFMYGFNAGPTALADFSGVGGPIAAIAGRYADRHEGEWERIVVRLDPQTNRATSVLFFAHTCAPQTVQWSAMTDADTTNGQIANGTHPVVYSASGSHASYPAAIRTPATRGICKGFPGDPINVQGFADRARGDGKVWQTWTVKMQDEKTAGWYQANGYGGAWGEVGSIRAPGGKAINTGPLGPPHKADTQ